MAIKKSQLYRSLWKSCDELRGGMDASQYKDYVLTLLFMKYISDKYGDKPDGVIVVPEGGSFADMIRAKNDKEIGDRLNKIIARLAEANSLQGVIDVADFNDAEKLGRGKEMIDRLTKLVAIFQDIDLRANRTEGDDLLGDAYEYLMRHFATESGKSKGQFYTPAEVSRVMAKVIGVESASGRDVSVYDPTCGSGSLLLKVSEESPKGLSIYGQEMDNATWSLAVMNMFLHDMPTAEIWKGNTLANPDDKGKQADGSLKTYDYVVANPPFSNKNWTSGMGDPASDEFGRFRLGIPPAKNGDYAFLLHILTSMKTTGRAAVILPHGVLFRGNAEGTIRRNLIRHGYIKGIIGLPPNLFYGTGIPACIVVLDKAMAATRTGVFMVDASRGFLKDGAKNRLRDRDLHKIVDVFTNQWEEPRYSRLVPTEEIERNGFNLNLPRYIDSSEPEDIQDLDAHLNGGIPVRDVDALHPYWDILPGVRDMLFGPGDRPGYLAAKLEPHEVKPAILNHPDFVAFSAKVDAVFAEWRAAHEPTLMAINSTTNPKALIGELSEDLLERFRRVSLLDRYDIYQHLMDYWTETMQDDVYLVVQNGWGKAAQLQVVIDSNDDGSKEQSDLTVDRKKYRADLIQPELLVGKRLPIEQGQLNESISCRDRLQQQLDEFLDEHAGDESVLESARNERGLVTKATVKDRLRSLPEANVDDPESAALLRCLELFDAIAERDRENKRLTQLMKARLVAEYSSITDAEVRRLVVHDKWLATLQDVLGEDVYRHATQLSSRVSQLETRYVLSLSYLACQADVLNERVKGHLAIMGVSQSCPQAKW